MLPWSSPHTMPTHTSPTSCHPCLHVRIIYMNIQRGTTALELAAGKGQGKVVGVLIGAGMAAGQDVNACLGSVLCVCVCMGARVL